MSSILRPIRTVATDEGGILFGQERGKDDFVEMVLFAPHLSTQSQELGPVTTFANYLILKCALRLDSS